MNAKITIYFTPDIKENSRIPITDIRFAASENQSRGRYQLDFTVPCLISAQCTSHRSSVKSAATINFQSTCFGEKTKYVIKTNDYFEIWDTADLDNPWCYFRGVVRQTTNSLTGDRRTFSVMLENAGGWILGDNAIYYLGQLIITRKHATVDVFRNIKTKYGWADQSGKLTNSGKAIELLKIKNADQLLETLINRIGNKRIELLKTDFYDDHESIKTVDYITDSKVYKNDVFVVDKIAEMEGSILSILRQFEGRPFSEIFMFETPEKTRVIWRNSRWRDSDQILCMGDNAGTPENIISIYTDPTTNYTNTSIKTTFSAQNGYRKEKLFSGVISETDNNTTDDVVNGFYIYPAGFGVKNNVPGAVIQQTAYDSEGARQILSEESVIRQGYRPIAIQLPFIPDFGTQEDFNKKNDSQKNSDIVVNSGSQGQFMSEYTRYAAKMFRNIQDSGNGQTVMKNNLQCTVADDYRVFETEQDIPKFISVNRLTWFFSPENPKTVLEWDRGFESLPQS